MELFKARYPERAMKEAEERSTATVKLSEEYEGYITSDGSEFWTVHFLKLSEGEKSYVASGVCSGGVGTCTEEILSAKNNLLSLLEAGKTL